MKKRMVFNVAMIVSLLAAAGASAAQITGYVTDYYGTAPVAGVSVRFLEYYGADSTVYSAVTGADGRYVVSLPAGTYLASVNPNGGETRYQAQYYGGVLSPYWSYAVTVEEGSVTEDINFYLWVGYRVSGRVTGAGGASDVLIYDHTTGLYYWGMTGVRTDENGVFTVNIPQGVYSFFAYADGHWTPAERSPVVINDDTGGVVMAYPAVGTVSGRVTLSGGGAAVSVRVDALDVDTGYSVGYATTDDNGDYRIGGLPAGRSVYLLVRTRFHPEGAYADVPAVFWPGSTSPDGASPVAVTAAGVSGKNIALPGSGGEISGRVTDSSGSPIEGATVYDFYYPGVLNPYVPISQRTALTDSDGRYRLAGIGAARIGVAVVADGYVPRFWNGVEKTTLLDTASPIDVSNGGSVSGIDFALRPTTDLGDAPSVTSVSPHLLYGVGEKTIVITGSGFRSGADVDLVDMYPFRYDGNYPEIRRVHVQSDRVEVTVAVDAETARGPYFIAVTNPDSQYVEVGFSVITPFAEPQISVLAAPPVFNSDCTLTLGWNMENLTLQDRTVDAYLGLVLPAGDAIFYDGETFTMDFVSMFSDETLSSGYFLPQSLMFEIPLGGAEMPAGDYLWFAALTDAGTYDIVSLTTKTIHY